MKKTLHIISHTHWDREWYMSFEQHRMRLVELMDTLIEKMENDERYKFFHLDGQTIIIDDYLEIKPKESVIIPLELSQSGGLIQFTLKTSLYSEPISYEIMFTQSTDSMFAAIKQTQSNIQYNSIVK
jgi:hypothetical protein